MPRLLKATILLILAIFVTSSTGNSMTTDAPPEDDTTYTPYDTTTNSDIPPEDCQCQSMINDLREEMYQLHEEAMRCNETKQCCNETMQCCNETMQCCNETMQCCNETMQCCNETMQCCNETMQCCDDAMQCCDDAMQCCNGTGDPDVVAFHATIIFPPDLNRRDTVKFNLVMLNKGDGYSTGTGKFTAPVAGYYYFYNHILVQEGEVGVFALEKNGLALCQLRGDNNNSGANDSDTGTCAATVRLKAEQWVRVRYIEGTDKTPMMALDDYCGFTGFLIRKMS